MHITVLTSAYPRHCPRPWLLEESLPVRHAVDTCSRGDVRARTGLRRSGSPFAVACRTGLSTGFLRGGTRVDKAIARPLSSAILAQPTATLYGWSLFTMVQPPLHLRCPWATVLDGMRARVTWYRLFVPLFGFDGQSSPKGRRCHSSTKRTGITPARSSSYTV